MQRMLSYLACLWAINGGLCIASETWAVKAVDGIQVINTALLTIGGTAILLYQRKLSADREVARQADLVMSKEAFCEVRARLDAVIEQRNRATIRNDQLFDQLVELTRRVERVRCVFPLADGSARCAGKDTPECGGA
jgi:hypothetical protein